MKAKRKVKVGCLVIFIGFIVVSQIVSSCISFSKTEREVEAYFANISDYSLWIYVDLRRFYVDSRYFTSILRRFP